jgi:phosphatidylglycerophosphatase A
VSATSVERRLSPADRAALAVLTALGLGYSPVGPGTAGSVGGVLLFWAAHACGKEWLALPLAAAFFLATWVLAPVAIRVYGGKDPQMVVSDEVAGLLFAVAFSGELTGGAFWTRALLGFLLFRVYDIVKPGPVRALERLPGGLGIAADDAAAGILANATLVLAFLGARLVT